MTKIIIIKRPNYNILCVISDVSFGVYQKLHEGVYQELHVKYNPKSIQKHGSVYSVFTLVCFFAREQFRKSFPLNRLKRVVFDA